MKTVEYTTTPAVAALLERGVRPLAPVLEAVAPNGWRDVAHIAPAPGLVLRLKRRSFHYAADTLFACVGGDRRHLRVKSHCNTESPGPSLLWERAGDWFIVVEPVLSAKDGR